MPKRSRTRGRLDGVQAERARTRRAVAVMAGTLLILAAAVVAAWRPWRLWSAGDEHPHRPPPHGGTLVSLGGRGGHYHVEAVLGEGGALTVYPLQDDAATALPVEARVLTAHVRPAGGRVPTSVVLLPAPGDRAGVTAQFAGRLPRELWGERVAVTVDALKIGRTRYRVAFPPAGVPAGRPDAAEADRRLYLVAGGKYTAADIAANGRTTAADRFARLRPAHVPAARPGERVCPVAGLKADPRFRWVVDGKAYEFCCQPCVDVFVRRAKERPGDIRGPDDYVER